MTFLPGADPFLLGRSGLNLLHIIALNEPSTPCLAILIRYRENAVNTLMNSVDSNDDTLCHIAAKRHNSAFVRALLQTGNVPQMIKNGEGK
jgi:ankyrin repeat protein